MPKMKPSKSAVAILDALIANEYSIELTGKALGCHPATVRRRFATAVPGKDFATWRDKQIAKVRRLRAAADRANAAPEPEAVTAAAEPELAEVTTMGLLARLAEAVRKPLETIADSAQKAEAWRDDRPGARRRRADAQDDADEKPIAGGTIESPEARILIGQGTRFVLSCAQNNTHVHPGVMEALGRFCERNNAKLLISRFGYNKKGWRQPEKDGLADEEIWYDPATEPFLCRDSVRLARDLIFCGELNISPTAVDPTSGMDGYTKSASAVFPHVKVQMKSLATMKSDPARHLFTTGTVTQRNYLERKAGQKASFHHVFGALYVEVDEDGDWFARQLVASDDGSFQDLNLVYSEHGVRPARVECITWGDFHEEKQSPEIHDACFGPGGILDLLRPKEQHVHDLADFMSRNHHNIKDPYFHAQMRQMGAGSVEKDLARCASKLEVIERDWCQTVVVESNHDQAFRRWLCEADGHRDTPNARYWHYWNYRMYEALEAGRDPLVFEEAVRALSTASLANTKFLREDESWIICGANQNVGIECGLHGHRGPNGSRGSPRSYRVLGHRCNTAHTHSAGIIDGIYTAGVSGHLNMGYNRGPSSWSHSHVLTYESGKRAIITMRGKKWRALDPGPTDILPAALPLAA